MHKLFVFSGCSGVGKSTILAKVMEQREDLRFSVSATTRQPRAGERDGVDYYFVSQQKFLDMIASDAFLEYDAHMDNYYGTPREQLEEKLETGNVILDIEPNGAFHVRQQWPEAVLVFLAPPSVETLEKRLRNRGDTSDEQIKLRMERAKWEMDQGQLYDYYVVNDRLDHCVEQILEIIAKEAN